MIAIWSYITAAAILCGMAILVTSYFPLRLAFKSIDDEGEADFTSCLEP